MQAPIPPPSPTCGDTDGNSTNGLTPFNCASFGNYAYWSEHSTTSLPAAADLTNTTNRDACCKPGTCSDIEPFTEGNQQYACTGSTVFNTAHADYLASPSACCRVSDSNNMCSWHECHQQHALCFSSTLCLCATVNRLC